MCISHLDWIFATAVLKLLSILPDCTAASVPNESDEKGQVAVDIKSAILVEQSRWKRLGPVKFVALVLEKAREAKIGYLGICKNQKVVG